MSNKLFEKQSGKATKTLLALFLVLTITSTLVSLPNASAHTPPLTIATSAYVSAAPDTVGVNQPTTIVMWLNYIPPTATGQYGDKWHGCTIEVTKPDGTTQTLGPFTLDASAAYAVQFTPDQIGNYTLVSKFPTQVLAGDNPPPQSIILSSNVNFYLIFGQRYINDTFLASTSEPLTLVVTQQPVNNVWPEAPLPTNYWTNPITALNANWYQIAGNWLSGSGEYGGTTSGYTTSLGVIAPYTTGPSSAHIMWTKPLLEGGLGDGAFGAESYWSGIPYQPAGLNPPIILNGVLYYNVMTEPKIGWYAVDLRTGKQLYYVNETGPVQLGAASAGGNLVPNNLPQLSFGQVLAFNTINEDGTHPYLWSAYTVQYSNASLPAALNTTWAMYDAGSGNWICNIINVPAGGTTITGSDGSICKFIISGTGANERLLVWNTTQAIWWEGTQQQWQAGDYSAFGGGGYDGWLPQLGRSYDGINGYFYNVTIPTLTGSIFSVQDGVAVYGGTSGSNNGTGTIIQGTMWALNLNPAKGSIGSLLWNYTFTPPVNLAPQGFNGLDGIAIFGGLTGPTVYPNDGVFLFEQGQTADCWYCYNLTNGQLMWTSAKEGDQWSSFGLASVIYNGELYSYGVSFGYPGNVYAIDMKTGKTLWDYASGETSSVLGWQNTPIAIMGAAGGILYVAGTDTFPTNPYPQGINLYALNATTGEVIWQIPFYPPGTAQKIAIADGYLVGANTYDNQIYCFGKGQTATAVTAPSIGVTTATPITITGAVKDLSAGAQQQAVAANFPNGLPCVSDASMSQFMEAVYMQQPMPNNITGVPVTFSVLDSNNNTYAIGSTTTDASGTYGFTWTPPVPGSYTIYATFAGSNSYYSSSAETHIYASAQTSASASPAPVSSPTQSISPAPAPGSAAPLATYIAIAAVIVIVVVIAAALILRRRK